MTLFNDDLSGSYGMRTEKVGNEAALADLLSRFGAEGKARNNPEPEKPTQTADGNKEKSLLSTVGAVGADVAQGLTTDLFGAVATGVHEAAQETVDFVTELGDSLFDADEAKAMLDNEDLDPIVRQGLETALESQGDRLLLPQLPEGLKPDTVTGGIINDVSQFLTGFFGAGKFKALKGAKTKGGQFAQTAAKGAVADAVVFDPHEERLSDLVQSVPELQNPVTEFLAADPNDTAAEGRLKNAIEGSVLGFAADALFLAVKATRSGLKARRAKLDAERTPEPEFEPGISLEELGDPLGDNVGDRLQARIDSEPEAVAVDYAKLKGTNGGKVLDADTARELSPEYLADRSKAAEVHEAASNFIQRQFDELIEKPPREGEENQVTFLAGGTGAGKSTAKDLVPEIIDESKVVLDGTMKSYKKAVVNVQKALDAGNDVTIVYVHREPADALEGALHRAERQAAEFGTGRTVPTEVFAQAHEGAPATAVRLQDKFKDDPRFTLIVVDNTHGANNAKLADVDLLRNVNYTNLAKEADTQLEEAFKNGEISEKTYRGFKSEKAGSEKQALGGRVRESAEPRSLSEQLSEAQAVADGRLDPATITSPVEEPQTFINFARIDTPEDIQNAIQRLADADKTAVDSARRGKIPQAQTELSAAHVDAWETLSARRKGEPLNAEQSVAVRQLWAASADRTAQLAKTAATNPSEANLFAFRKQMAIHNAIQQQVIAARTETARALASWKIPAGTNAERFRGVMDALNSNGGSDLTKEMAERVAALADKGMTRELDKVTEKLAGARTKDALVEAWINGLLSGPKTHLVNMLSNTSVMFQQMGERAVAGRMAAFMGDEGSVAMGEATAQWQGLVSAIPDAFRFSVKSFITGNSGYGMSKIDTGRPNAISSESLQIRSDSMAGRFVDTLAAVAPTRFLNAEDEFFKTFGYRMELHAQALRTATKEVNDGQIPADQLKDRMADIIDNPPENVRIAAVDNALYQTFTNPGGNLSKRLIKTANEYPAFRVLMPFIRTPANILTYTFHRTPLAPLFSGYKADIAAGGARRDIARARMATGTMIMFTTADLAMSGALTGQGPADRSERSALMRSGWKPYSVKMGDRYFAYNRLDPIGMTMGLAADMVDILNNQDDFEEGKISTEEAVIAIAASIGNNTMSKTYLSGLSEFFEAMSDPTRYSDNYARRLASSIIPTISGEVARQVDPYMRETQTIVEALMKKTPGLSDNLPVRRNLWGEPITYQSGLGKTYDTFSPIYSSAMDPEPIDEEIIRLEATVLMPKRKTTINGVRVNLNDFKGAYSRYVQLAGNELKSPFRGDLGAKDYLNQLITGKLPESALYNHALTSDGPDGGKANTIKKVLQEYQESAKAELVEEFPELAAFIENEVAETNAQQMEALQKAGGLRINAS